MTFTVRYRAKDGSVAEETIEAADRSDCFAKCKSRGIAVMELRVDSGKLRVGGGNPEKHCPTRPARLTRPTDRGLGAKLLIVIADIVVAGAGIWFFLNIEDEPKAEPGKRKAKTVRRVEKKTSSADVPTVTNEVPKALSKPVTPPVTGKVIKVGFTRQMRTLPDGTKEPLGKPKFTNAIERAFSTLCNPGGMAIPFSVIMRRFSEDEILRIINQPMVYDPADSDELIERKFAVQQFKDQIREYLKAGNTLQQAIAEVDAASRSENIYRNMSQVGFIEALRTGDGETVRRYVQEQNVELGKRGMRQLTVPLRYRLQEKQQNGETK